MFLSERSLLDMIKTIIFFLFVSSLAQAQSLDLGASFGGGGGGSGTVTSVGLADSTNIFNITGSPVTTAGTLTIASLKSQSAKTFLGAPTGSSGAPSFRILASGDIPSLSSLYCALTGCSITPANTSDVGLTLNQASGSTQDILEFIDQFGGRQAYIDRLGGIHTTNYLTAGNMRIGGTTFPNTIFNTGQPISITTTAGLGIEIDVAGHLTFTSAAPVASSCGSGSVVAGSSDNKGQVIGITAATACTLTFSSAISSTPACVFSSSAASAVGITSISASAVTVGMASLTGSLYYLCF